MNSSRSQPCADGESAARPDAAPAGVAPFALFQRVRMPFSAAEGSVMAIQQFDLGWKVWVHIAAYGSNHIVDAADLRAAIAKATGQ